MRDLNDEIGGKRLPEQLGDGRDGTDERVFVSLEVRGLAKPKEGAVPQHGLVQDLEEIHPDEYSQDGLVRLASNAPVLES